MSPLSAAELSPTRLCHRQPLPNVPQLIRWCLEDGNETAEAIKTKTGLPLEVVYEGLVWLEGHGKAAVAVCHRDRNKTGRFVSWGAL